VSTISPNRATVDDLYRTEGKAELIGGRVVHLMPTGFLPSRIAARVFRSLDDYAEAIGRGFAFTDNTGFTVPELPSGRESFSPDASYYDGPPPSNPMRFIEGPPALAVEVRSEADYGPAAEREMAAKRENYFAAGTAVVWDVDPRAGVIRCYRAADPDHPVTFARGQRAGAEPAVAGWAPEVDTLLGPA
jgi:Uma2 family endonuclease